MPEQLSLQDVVNAKRTKLGEYVGVPVFRSLRLIALETIVGMAGSGIVYQAGKEVGRALNFEKIDEFLDWVEKAKVGIPEVDGKFVRIYECITCSGLPNLGRPVCHFEGGLIAGFLENLLQKKVIVKEIKCWGLGHEVCEFEVKELPYKLG